MNLIDHQKYKIYQKYDGDYYVLSRPSIWSRKHQKIMTEEDFFAINKVEENIEMLKTGLYAKEFSQKLISEINKLQSLFTPEMFQELTEGVNL